ncbi:peptidase family A16 [Necator americanus]|uniref:Peptidase family A16 n=1 Tax=Necator americanus TaxID=51031 RepID=W2TTS8_NECAM|nr:peptidase family A16 [Necator americanus]ETN84506.1 peptidase family A16 [Necator americanus]
MSIDRSVSLLKNRWVLAQEFAKEHPDEQGELPLLESFQSHWETNEMDQAIEEASALHDRLEVALKLLPPSEVISRFTPCVYDAFSAVGSSSHPSLVQQLVSSQQYSNSPHRSIVDAPLSGRTHSEGIEDSPPGPNTPTSLDPPTSASTAGAPQQLQPGNNTPSTNPHALSILPLAQSQQQSAPGNNLLTGNPNQYTLSNTGQHLKLPAFELPDFSGELDAFPAFWELFSVTVHNNTSVPPAVKFLYLKTHLKGNAANLIASFKPTAENYEDAVRIILNTYNRPEILRSRLWDSLVEMSSSSDSVIAQRSKLCSIKATWLQMKNLNEDSGSTGTTKIILSKFPKRTREKVGELKKKGDPIWTVEELLEALDTVVQQLEMIEDTDPIKDPPCSIASSNHPSSHSPIRRSGRPRSPSRYTDYQPSYRTPSGRNRVSPCSSPEQRSPRSLSPSFTRSSRPSVRQRYQSPVEPLCPFCRRRGHAPEYCTEVQTPQERRDVVRVTLAIEYPFVFGDNPLSYITMTDREDIPPYAQSEGKQKKGQLSRRQQDVYAQSSTTASSCDSQEEPTAVVTPQSAPSVLVSSTYTHSPLSHAPNIPSSSLAQFTTSIALDSAQCAAQAASKSPVKFTHKQATTQTPASPPSGVKSTVLTSMTPDVKRRIMSLAQEEARRNLISASNELELREIIATIERQRREAHERSNAAGKDVPLKANPYAHYFFPTLTVTEHAASYIIPHTVEELTAHQLRVVYEYIARTNSIRSQIPSLVENPPEVEMTPEVEREQNVGTLIVCKPAHQIRYTVLMAWIHELQHFITAITVQRDLLQELMLPRFLSPAGDQDYMRATLEVFHVTEDVLREALMSSAAISAHATRLIRTLEAFQLMHVLYHQHRYTTPLDEDYQRLLVPPQTAPTEPSVTQGVTKKPAAAQEQPKASKNAALWTPTEDVSPRRLTAASSVDPSLGKESTSESSGDSNATVAPTASRAPSVVTKLARASDPTLADFRRSISSQKPHQDIRVATEAGKKEQQPNSPPAKSTEPSKESALSKQSSSIPSSLRAKPRSPSPSSFRGEAGLPSNRLHFGEGTSQDEPQFRARESLDRARARSRDPPSVRSCSVHSERQSPSRREPWHRPPCAFCLGNTHWSAECPNYRILSERVYMAEDYRICSNCLRDHFGDCIRVDNCAYCRIPGHHPAFCVDNPYVESDVGMPARQFYQEIARRTYQRPPPGRICRRPHDYPRRRSFRQPSRSPSSSPSRGRYRY